MSRPQRTKIFVKNIHSNNSQRDPDRLLPTLIAKIGTKTLQAKQLALYGPDGVLAGRLLYDRRHQPQVWIEWYGTVEAEDWEMET